MFIAAGCGGGGGTSLPTLSIDDVTLAEGNEGTTPFVFTVTMSAASSTDVTVDYASTDGTATVAAGDYTAVSGTLTITAGETSGTITVLVNGDTKVEPDETFTVTLSNASGATIADAVGTGTIIDDDFERKLLASDGEAYAYFGLPVSLDGNRALVGACGDNDNGTDSGSAYIFDLQ